jgi:predicted  nucleic acid-binding Zn ribbon protein|tara:strand:- start:177 stop:401 length:225 start_codon:yes stop_codon:yes gene_type:complete
MKRSKEKGRVMNEIQRQTTEKVHNGRVVYHDVISESTSPCPKCDNELAYFEESILTNKYYLLCNQCGHEEGSLM